MSWKIIKLMFVLSITCFFISSCKNSSSNIDAEFSYKRIGDVLEFTVSLSSPSAIRLGFYENIEENLILGILPFEVKGRKSFILTERGEDFSSVVVSENEPYVLSFTGVVNNVDATGVTTVDFGNLGYIEIPLGQSFTIGVKVFPKDHSVMGSNEGIVSNHIKVSI